MKNEKCERKTGGRKEVRQATLQGNALTMTFQEQFSAWRGKHQEKTQTAQTAPWTAESLANCYLEPLAAYVSRRIAHEMEAEDIVAEVFMDVCSQLERIPRLGSDSENDATLAYLIGMARRKIALSLRKRERHKEETLPQNHEEMRSLGISSSSESQLLGKEQAEMLRKTLEAIPEIQREVLLLKYVENLSLREIGKIIGKSEQAVSSLLRRARESARRKGSLYKAIKKSPSKVGGDFFAC